MNNLNKFMVINGIFTGKSLDTISQITEESIDSISSEIFGIDSCKLKTIFSKMEESKKYIDDTPLVKTLLNFLHLNEYAMSINNNDGSIINSRILRDLILSDNLKNNNVVQGILISMFSGFTESSNTFIKDGMIYSVPEDFNNLNDSIVRAFSYFMDCNKLITKQQLLMLRGTLTLDGGLNIPNPNQLLTIINKCLNKDYHPCILSKTCLDIYDLYDIYTNLGFVVHRSQKDRNKVLYIDYNSIAGSHFVNRCDQSTFIDIIRERLQYV